MLLARAPVRLSLAGGGTDVEPYYSRFGGMVVSATIDKYFYALINPSEGPGVRISSSDYRAFYRRPQEEAPVWDGDPRLPRALLHQFGISRGLSILLVSEVPPGTGLGSSSAVAVALAKGLSTLRGQRVTAAQVADLATLVEIEELVSPAGKADHYAAAFGGINAFHFDPEAVSVEPLPLGPAVLDALHSRLLLFFTGAPRTVNGILQKQRQGIERNDQRTLAALHVLKAAAVETREALLAGNLRQIGEILHDSWQLKRRLARSVSNPRIDEIYERARRRGALGGTTAGPGGGGCLLLYCEPDARDPVAAEMRNLGLYQMDFHFDFGGAKVLMDSKAEAARQPVPLHRGTLSWREAYVF